MVSIPRIIASHISSLLFRGKAILVLGPRQSGKTTMMQAFLGARPEPSLVLNGDELDVRELLGATTSTALRALFGRHRIVLVDEAQRIPEIGLTLKLCTDGVPDVQVIATGSSSFDLRNRASEPLTGRKYELLLLPFSFEELCAHHGLLEEKRLLEHRLVFGAYPEIVTHPGEEERLLRLLASSYLYKDILASGGVKKPAVLEKLLRAVALQVGAEVSMSELSGLVGVSSRTVESYLDVLEKAFVVFKLPALARNVRNEIRKGKKIYFHDNGIRNAVIGNFAPLRSRTDVGALWENYLVSERHKLLSNRGVPAAAYFWRTAQQQEIDYVEERDGEFRAFEFKWSPDRAARFSATFSQAYPVRSKLVVTPRNTEEFLLDPEGRSLPDLCPLPRDEGDEEG